MAFAPCSVFAPLVAMPEMLLVAMDVPPRNRSVFGEKAPAPARSVRAGHSAWTCALASEDAVSVKGA